MAFLTLPGLSGFDYPASFQRPSVLTLQKFAKEFFLHIVSQSVLSGCCIRQAKHPSLLEAPVWCYIALINEGAIFSVQ